MSPVIHVTEAQARIIQAILGSLTSSTLAFGSRVTGRHRPFSDLDLCVKAVSVPDDMMLGRLREAFQSSDLPFTVDLTVYDDLPRTFQEAVDRDGVRVSEAHFL